MGEIVVYAVSEDELRLLERGSPASTFLNLGIFFASVGASFLLSLLITDVKSSRTFVVLTVVTVVMLIAGFVMFVLWRRWSGDAESTIKRIRERALTVTTEETSTQ